MGHEHNVHDSDARFIIDPVTRMIKNQSKKKIGLIQGDHNSEIFSFTCPRFIEFHDMSQCNKVEVHYFNYDAQTNKFNSGIYEADDLQVGEDENNVEFSWCISGNGTQLQGRLEFLIRFKCEEEGIVTYSWNTAFFTEANVGKGSNADSLFEKEYVDIIAQWKAKVMQTFKDDLTAWKTAKAQELAESLTAWEQEAKEDIEADFNAHSAEWNQKLATEKAERKAEVSVERARIDNIVALKEGSTTGDAELQDARIGADGITYPSAGTAIRTQIKNILEGETTDFSYTISESSTYALNGNIQSGKRYKVSVVFGDNVTNIDIGYTTTDGNDILLIDNAISGQEYEFTPEYGGTRFRFWTYLKEAAETTVDATLSVVGSVKREANLEKEVTGITNSIEGYKARVTKDSLTVAAGYTLQAFYTIKPGKKFYVVFDSFNYDAIDRLNIYCNNTDGNEIFHDALTPVIGEMYECYTEKENSNLILYLAPTETGGAVDFYISIYDEDDVREKLKTHGLAIDDLKQKEEVIEGNVQTLFEEVGLPLFAAYTKELKLSDALDIECAMSDDEQYMVHVESYTGQNFTECQLYYFNSMADFIAIQSTVQVGDAVTFKGNSAYKYIRVYTLLSEKTDTDNILTVKVAKYNGDALKQRVESLEETVFKNPVAPNILVIGDSYSQIGYWIDQLKNLVHLGDIVNLGVSSASLKDKYADREIYPYDDRPVSNDTRGGNVNTFGSQIEKLKRLMKGEDMDQGEVKVYENSAPDIILIEGGTNDPIDSTTEGYVSQIYTVEKAYIKRRSDSSSALGYIKIPTPYENTNRTTFGGAVRYIYGVLHEMFPEALMFFITPCGLTYMSGGVHDYLGKGEQIKYAASLLGIPVIDWGVNGRLSVCDNVISGSGTSSDPYIFDAAGEYSLDALHPNTEGAYFLAQEVAKVLFEYNLVEYKES